ncbi:MAG: S8 family serine peptidase [Firmicutes bacterium]|nr:S8 family serine peptidase [Bacillota bacterium]
MLKKILPLLAVLCMSVTAYAGEGDYIVKMKDGLVRTMSADDDTQALGENMYVTDKQKAESLLESGLAELIEPDMPVEVCADSAETPNDTYYSRQVYFDKMKIPVLQQKYDGKVRIAVIDSGVNRDHPDLKDANIETGYNFVDNNYDTGDHLSKNGTAVMNGHGTKVAAVLAATPNNGIGIAGIVPNATIVPLVTVTDDGGYTSDVIECINAAANQYDCKLMNLSVGVSNSANLQLACNKAAEKGIIIICAAGNEGNTSAAQTVLYPAGYESTISVGAVLSNFNLASYSRKCENIDTAAVFNSMYLPNSINSYDYTQGTSFAAPVVTGIAALLASGHPDYHVESIRDIIKGASVDVLDTGKDYAGYGVLMCDEIEKMINYKMPVFISPYLDGSSTNVKLYSKLCPKSVLIKARYKDNVLTGIETEDIVFGEDNLFCTSADRESGETFKFFVWDSLAGQKNYSEPR